MVYVFGVRSLAEALTKLYFTKLGCTVLVITKLIKRNFDEIFMVLLFRLEPDFRIHNTKGEIKGTLCNL